MDEERILAGALAREDPDQRTAWLDEACANDQRLRRRVEALLDRHTQPGSTSEGPAPAVDESTIDQQRVDVEALPAAEGPHPAGAWEVAGHSVLHSLVSRLPAVPHISLRKAEHDEDPQVGSSATSRPRQGGSRYDLGDEIARGGMGAIIKGRDLDLGRDLAIKVLLDAHADDPAMLQRFVEEAQIGGQLQHPGIVPVYELGQFADARPFFTMKLVKGQTLDSLLRDRQEPRQERTNLLGIFQQVCRTLAYAHSRGVIHRDLKPSNIMVGAFGEVQVMDWGLAKVLGDESERRSVELVRGDATVVQTQRSRGRDSSSGGQDTSAGSVIGTPAYMPPEQALGEVDRLDERCDVFGLGAILCAILTGHPPYQGGDRNQVFRRAIRGDLRDAHERLAQCGAEHQLIELTRRCLAVEPEDRYRDAGEVAEELTTYLQAVERRIQEAEVARHRALVQAAEERKRRRVTLALACSVVFTLVVGGGAWAWIARDRAAREVAEHARRLATDARVLEALNEADRLSQQARSQPLNNSLPLAEAGQAVRRAVAMLQNAPRAEHEARVKTLTARIEQLRRDSLLLQALEVARIRGTQAAPGEHRVTRELSVPVYEAAFRDFGMEAVKSEPPAVAQRIRQSPAELQTAIVAALDRWGWLVSDKLGLQLESRPRSWHVLAVVPGSAADVDGRLQPGDRILAVGPGDASELTPLAGVRHSKLAALMDGDTDTLLQLKVIPFGAKQETVYQVSRDSEIRAWLSAVLESADQDSWRSSLREKLSLQDVAGLTQLAAEAEVSRQPPFSLITLATGLNDLDQTEAAIELLERAQRYHAGDFWSNYYLSGFHQQSDPPNHESAIRFAQAAVAVRPYNAVAHYNLCYSLKRHGQFAAATEFARHAIELDPEFSDAYGILGNCLAELGRADEAIEAYRRAIELPQGLGRPWFNLGRTYLQLGRLDEAITAADQAIAEEPDSPAYNILAVAYKRQGNLDEAIAANRKSLERDPEDILALNNLGNALKAQGRYAEAIEQYEECLRLDPEYGDAHMNLANALKSLGRMDAAVVHFETAMRLNPEDEYVPLNLGNALVGHGRFAAAIPHLRKAIELAPDWDKTHIGLALALDATGDYEGVLASFQRLQELHRDNPEQAQAAAAAVERATRIVDQAVRLPEILSAGTEQDSAQDKIDLAQICLTRKRFVSAARLYGAALAAEPVTSEGFSATRYNAACAAAMAAAGEGGESEDLDARARQELRSQTLTWLRAELINVAGDLDEAEPAARGQVERLLRVWQDDPQLASLREQASIAKLPDDEQVEFSRFWQEVRDILERAQQ